MSPNQEQLVERVVDCPRCHSTCGWCGDYRHMHGQLRLPGSRRKCTIDFHPEGENCPMCLGSKRVTAVTHYTPARSALKGDCGRPRLLNSATSSEEKRTDTVGEG